MQLSKLMKTLQGNKITLKALEPEDLDFLFRIENDESIWELSNTITPFSKALLKQYIENAHLDIFQVKQLRLTIVENTSVEQVGFIDLFDFDPINLRAGIGIIIDDQFQNRGFATEALELLIEYSFVHLRIHQLFANITSDNLSSIKLFENNNFKAVGTKKDWISTPNGFKDEILYQLINE